MVQDDGLYPGMKTPPVLDLAAERGRALSTVEELERLAVLIRACTKCDLAAGRTQAVPGEGNPRAMIMFVGEAPGAKEDATGRPFVGASGKFLDNMLRDIGLERADVFIANVNRCRPPNNRDPNPVEVAACSPYLHAQIQAIRPRVICPLGRFALAVLVDPQWQISKVHGQLFERDGTLIVPLYHPAAALHRQDLRDTLLTDMRHLRVVLEERGLWK